MRPFRSLLFVPGTRPERFSKAIAAGPDAVCVDLEDAVPPADKDAARATVLDWFAGRAAADCAIGVRINALSTLEGLRDVLGLAESEARPDFVMIPKAHTVDHFEQLGLAFADRPRDARPAFWGVIETSLGLLKAQEVAAGCMRGAHEAGGILFGGADYSAELGVAMEWEPLFHARSTLAATLAPNSFVTLMDVPFLDVGDAEGLRAEAMRAKALGFRGKACVHPAQVAVVNEVFAPSAAEMDWARRVMAAGDEAAGGPVLLDGKLLDTPVYLRARRMLGQADVSS